jgi:hypothetical protein
MTEEELDAVIDAWVAAQETGMDSPEYEKNEWAVDLVIDWSLGPDSGNPELLWRFILATYKRDISQRVVGMLAAGPVENLLSEFGPDYIASVEDLARQDERFRWLLGGVWRLEMTDEVWQRLQSARDVVW